MTQARKWISFLILSMTGGIVFQVGYIRYVFLEDTYNALNLSAQDYGNIISVYGIAATIGYFIGGWFADKFSPKMLVAFAMIGTGIIDILIAMAPGYAAILILHVVMAFLGMGLYWSALVKLIGMLGDSHEQGRLFGYLEGVRGVVSTIVGFAGAWIVATAASSVVGVLWLIRIYGVCAILLGLAVWLIVKEDPNSPAVQARSTVTLHQLVLAAKNPYTWLIGFSIACIYAGYTCLGYFSPLLQHQFGLSAAFIGVIGVVRTYVFQFVAGPISGVVADKGAKSTPRFLRWMFIATIIILGVFLVMPRNESFMWIAVALMFLLTFAIFACRGVYWALPGEMEIPEDERGGVIGLASGIAYLPDAFLPSLAAWWIGDPAASPAIPEHGGGYVTMFIFLIVLALIGIGLTTVMMRRRTRELALVPSEAGN
ncbi:MFS transporter [Schaalia sp. ZJ405]|uniref:MFS transporter n=1 Tax=Schaalia sp. ZJ405 TaxID=2709403 RepID=UPI0013EA91D6|nr:MFS transporter [Schaalia sp. ZJ405]QPK81461.1 MFS transporter [Schaalia sp. ZJ405]